MVEKLLKLANNGRQVMAALALIGLCVGPLSMLACQSQSVQAGELTVTYYYIPR